MRFIVLGSAGGKGPNPEVEHLLRIIEEHGEIAQCDFTGRADLSESIGDFVIVLGGDGSILRAARQMGWVQRPVIAVNLGKLGFLAELAPGDLEAALGDLEQGHYQVSEHLMLRCTVFQEGESLVESLGLNELAVQSGPPFALMEVDLYVDDEWVTTYSCDGLIISTPIGSTAHNLSAGGPILRKDLQAFVISPISPHTLSHRPVVDSADRLYRIVIGRTRGEPAVVVDGVVLRTLSPGNEVTISRAPICFKLVNFPGRGYYRTLREKLGWGGQLEPSRGKNKMENGK